MTTLIKSRKLLICYTVIFFLSSICIKLSAQTVSDFELSADIKMDGIHLDVDTMYIAEGWDGSRIFRVTPDGAITTFATDLNGPIDILERDGYYYVSEWNAAQLSVLNALGEFQFTIPIPAGPGPMTLGDDNIIYITHNINNGSGQISSIHSDHSVGILTHGAPLVDPGGIDMANDGHLYVSNFSDGNVIRVNLADTSLTVISTISSTGVWKTGHLKAKDNVLYITGLGSHLIYTVNTNGEQSVFSGTGQAGHDGGELDQASYNFPNGLAFHEDGSKLFISRSFGSANYIQVITWDPINDIQEVTQTPIQIYPTPSNGLINIHADDWVIKQVIIYSITGQMIHNYSALSPSSSIRLNLDLAPGTYFIKVDTKHGQQVKKISIF